MLAGALADVVAKLPLRVDGDLCCLVESKAVNVELCDHDAGVPLDLFTDGWNPFSKTILNTGEFRQLTLPIRENTKGFGVAIL